MGTPWRPIPFPILTINHIKQEITNGQLLRNRPQQLLRCKRRNNIPPTGRIRQPQGLTPPDETPSEDGSERFAITPDNGDESGWPTSRFNAVTEDDDEVDVAEELAAYLKDGEVAVLFEVGSEKLRYLCGYATAVHSKGETVSLSLETIYGLARAPGPNITCTEY